MNQKEKRRVLVVDDETDIRMVVGLNLHLAGMEFGEASDGKEALQTLLRDEWDGVVLDLMMPNADGFEVLETLQERKMSDDMALVVLSARHAPATALEALRLGAHTHLTKPFSPAAVAQVLEELIEMTPEQRATHRTSMIERAGMLDRLGVNTV